MYREWLMSATIELLNKAGDEELNLICHFARWIVQGRPIERGGKKFGEKKKTSEETWLVRMDAAKFNEALARAGTSIKRVAADAGIDRATVYNALSWRGSRPETIGRIASTLGVDVSEIIEGGGSRHEDEKKPPVCGERTGTETGGK